MLTAEGLVAELAGPGAPARWGGMIATHDHARGCGAVADVSAVSLAQPPELPPRFGAEGRRFEYTIICAACAAAGQGGPATAATRI